MRLFVITHGTTDYGDRFVVREHVGFFRDPTPLAVVGTLEEARGAIEEHVPSLARLPRTKSDDKVIVESWGESGYVNELLAMDSDLDPEGAK